MQKALVVERLVRGAAKTPASLTNDQGAALPINIVTSFTALVIPLDFSFPPLFLKSFTGGCPKPPKQSRVISGDSRVGRLVTQLIKLVNIGTVIAIALGHREHELMSFGATSAVDRRSTSILTQSRDISGANKIIHVHDCIN